MADYTSNYTGPQIDKAIAVITDNILKVVEDGFYLIDESYNIGGYENAQGGNLINGGESSSDIAYDIIN